MNTNDPSVQDLFDLTGRVILLTGGTGHLGQAMAEALAEAGGTVALTSRERSRAAAIASRLPRPHGAPHLGVELDQLDATSIERGFDDVLRRAGRVDALINNAHEGSAGDWTTVTAEEFNRQLANASGCFLLARRFRTHVVERGGTGSVVMVGSMYGLVGSYPDAYDGVCPASPVAYHALKGGVVQMSRHLAVYWARDGVRVNSLNPGPFPAASAPAKMVERLTAKTPMRRMGKPHELKGAVVFLSSDASSYMTGQSLTIDGGWTAW